MQRVTIPVRSLFYWFFCIVGLTFISVSAGCSGTDQSSTSADEEAATVNSEYVQGVEEIAQHPQLQKTLQYLQETDAQTIEDQILLTEIPAPPFGEEERGAKFAEMLEEYGADSVWTDSIGNVIGLKKGTQRDSVLAIAGHLDTVFPEETDVTVEQKGDTLYAPGIGDDGRGLTTVLALLRSVDEMDLSFESDILFIGNVGEEGLGDLRGMKYLFREDGPQIDYFISVDGTRIGSVTNGALGSHRYKVTFKGPGGHSWGAFGLANPHHALGRAITHFVDNAEEYTKTGAKTSYNVGRIGGGTSVNSIPFESWMEVDMRSLSPERLNEIDTLFQDAMQQGLAEQNDLRREGPKMTVDIEMIGNRPSGQTPADESLVQWGMAAASWAGEEAELRTSSTDSNIPISLGIPAITIGGGGEGQGAHSLDEWYYNDEGYKGIQRALLVITAVAKMDLE